MPLPPELIPWARRFFGPDSIVFSAGNSELDQFSPLIREIVKIGTSIGAIALATQEGLSLIPTQDEDQLLADWIKLNLANVVCEMRDQLNNPAIAIQVNIELVRQHLPHTANILFDIDT